MRDGGVATSEHRAEKAEAAARSGGPQPLEGGSLRQGSPGRPGVFPEVAKSVNQAGKAEESSWPFATG